MTPQATTPNRALRRLGAVGLTAAFLVLGFAPEPANAQLDPATADLTDDGIVNFQDFSTIVGRLFTQAGEVGYREGLDFNADGHIDFSELLGVRRAIGQLADTEPTTLKGRVFDGLGNPLEGVTVQLGPGSLFAETDPLGNYSFDIIPSDHLGDTVITFHGRFNGQGAVDPSDGGSGQYPTIPNKPIFVNGGTDTRFRDMSLPERDLTGSVDLSQGGVATNTGGNTWLLNQEVDVQNAGVKLGVPAGCTAIFPDGENPVLSITRVDPAMLPVPMPPGLSSTIFVTYQPGGTEVECPAGAELFTKFNNSDGYNQGNGPFLAGITNGVFSELVACDVLDTDIDGQPNDPDDTLECGPIPVPFEFAWYHVDIPVQPCPRTTVVGTVRLNDGPMTPVAGASVSVPGVGPVNTAGDGTFSIPNVPAGPNGTLCFSNPFSLRASAAAGGDFGISGFATAVPGGTTDVGDIKFGISGTVQGKVLKLTSIDPFVVTPLEGADIDVDTVPFPKCCPNTDANGGYNVIDVPLGAYNVDVFFAGFLPEPGGGDAFKVFDDSQGGSIDFDGDLDIVDFRFTGTGAVRVRVTDPLGNPVPFVDVSLTAGGTPLGAGFVPPIASCNGFTNFLGEATLSARNFSCFSEQDFNLSGVPQGPCDIKITDFSSEFPVEIGRAGPDQGCFINAHGETIDVTVTAIRPGDIVDVTITEGFSGGEESFFFATEYSTPFSTEECFDIAYKLEFDTDQNPATGGQSLISSVAPGDTGLGVEFRLECAPFCELTLDDTGEVLFRATSSFGCVNRPEGDHTTTSVGIPKQVLIDAAGGPGPYNMALLSKFSGGGVNDGFVEAALVNGPGFEINDVVPNEGNFQFNTIFPFLEITDPEGDTFSGFNGVPD